MKLPYHKIKTENNGLLTIIIPLTSKPHYKEIIYYIIKYSEGIINNKEFIQYSKLRNVLKEKRNIISYEKELDETSLPRLEEICNEIITDFIDIERHILT